MNQRLFIIPETFIADEHHVHVYASKKNDSRIVKAPRPADLFRNCIATPDQVNHNSATRRALAYSINQEPYLRVFLTDDDVPMDNNPAEQAIRPFYNRT